MVRSFAHPRWRLLALLMGVIVANAFVGAVTALLSGTEPPAAFAVLAGAALLMAGVAVRFARLRVAVDGQGVTVVGLLSTRRVAHAEVWGFELQPGAWARSAKLVEATGARRDVTALLKPGEGGMRVDSHTEQLVGEANAAVAAARVGR